MTRGLCSERVCLRIAISVLGTVLVKVNISRVHGICVYCLLCDQNVPVV